MFARNFLSAKSYTDATDEELEIKIREQWEHFKESDLPLILKLVPVPGNTSVGTMVK